MLELLTGEEVGGIAPHAAFPTAIDVRDDHGADVVHGMADSRIGWARWAGDRSRPHGRAHLGPVRGRAA